MLSADVQLVLIDDHVVEPTHARVSRATGQMRDQAPHVVRMDDGMDAWVYQGTVYPLPYLGGTSGQDGRTWRDVAPSFENMRTWCYDPQARLEDMDIDGVWAQLSLHVDPRYAGHRLSGGPGLSGDSGLYQGLQRLHGRRSVRNGSRPLIPARDHAAVGSRSCCRGGRPDGSVA